MAFDLSNIEPTAKTKKSVDIDALLKKEISFGKGFTNKKKEHFYTELTVLLNAGISLKDALSLMAEEQKKAKDRQRIEQFANRLVAGSSFSQSVRENKEVSDYEFYSLKIGEESGTLAKVSHELGQFFKRRNTQRRTVIGALSYPIVVLCTAVLAVLFMLRFVVPMFGDIFKQNQVDLPWLTRQIIFISEGFQSYFWLIVILIIGLFVCKKLVAKKVWYKKLSARILLKLPFVGELIRKMYIGQFTQAIALLSSAKVPLLESIGLTKKMFNFYPLTEALVKVEEGVLEGKSLSQCMHKHSIFDRKMISLIKVAEETNQNEFVFERLTTQYNEDISHSSKMLSTVLEPVIIVFLGALVAVILIAMYLPMFTLSSVLG